MKYRARTFKVYQCNRLAYTMGVASLVTLLATDNAYAGDSVFWVNPKGGDYKDGSNWVGGSPPTGSQSAEFDVGGAYIVTLDFPHMLEHLWVRNGDEVTLTSGFAFLTLSGDLLPTSGGHLHLLDGQILSDGGDLVSGGDLTVEGVWGRWETSSFDAIVIGSGSVLSVLDGACVDIFGPVRIEASAGDGLYINGKGTMVATKDLTVGLDAMGTLILSGSSHLTTELCNVGRETGSNGVVCVTGPGTSWTVEDNDSIQIARDGTASMLIEDGARVFVESAGIITGGQQGNGSVIITDEGSAWIVGSNLFVGRIGFGELTIENGGTADANQVIIAQASSAEGALTVQGKGSSLTAKELVRIAIGTPEEAGIGTLTVSDLGSVSCPEMQVGHGGMLQGNGNILGNVIVDGHVHPGIDIGTLNITGNYSQQPDGALFIQVQTAEPATHDALLISGEAALDGHIHVEFDEAYEPLYGDEITIFTAQAVSGNFASYALPDLPDNLIVDVFVGESIVKLRIIFNPDLNGDGIVGPGDLAVLLGLWGPVGEVGLADLNGDSNVGPQDLAILLGFWGHRF